ncbi:MAG: hypothetical protein ACW98Y_09010 [Candidatus Thorarchaeota archaeon]
MVKVRYAVSAYLVTLLIISSQYGLAAGIPSMEQLSFILYPEEDSIDVDIDIPAGQSVIVNVVFNDSSIAGLHDVWPLITYTYPTKTVSEPPARFSYIEDVTFRFGWENLTLSPLFVSKFTVRVFFSGTHAVEVNITITYPDGIILDSTVEAYVNPIFGILAIVITIGTIIISYVLLSRRKLVSEPS